MHVSTLAPVLFAAYSMASHIYVADTQGSISTLDVTLSGDKYSVTKSSSLVACGNNPSWLSVNDNLLYCSNELEPGNISTFTFDDAGKLTPQASATIDVTGGVHHSVYGDGKYLVVAHYGQGKITTYKLPITADTKPLQTISTGDATSKPHQVAVDPTGQYVVSPDLADDVVRIFSIDASSGELTSAHNITMPSGNGPRHVDFTTPTPGTGDCAGSVFMYLASETASTITGFELTYPPTCGATFDGAPPQVKQLFEPLTTLDSRRNESSPLVAAGEIRVRGSSVTVSNRGDQSFGPGVDSLAVFPIQDGGKVGDLALYSAGGNFPRSMAFNKAGDLAVVGDQNSNTAVVLKRNVETGEISEVAGQVDMGAVPWGLVWGSE